MANNTERVGLHICVGIFCRQVDYKKYEIGDEQPFESVMRTALGSEYPRVYSKPSKEDGVYIFYLTHKDWQTPGGQTAALQRLNGAINRAERVLGIQPLSTV
jgi:hypothetical protein